MSKPVVPEGDEPLLTYTQAAALLGYTETYLRAKVMNREVPFLKIGHRVFFRRSMLEAWLRARIEVFVPEVMNEEATA